MRSLLLALLLVAVGCAPTYPIPRRPTPIACGLEGLARVDAHVLRSSQPNAAQLACVAASFPHEGDLHVYKFNRWWEGVEPKVRGVVTHYWPLDELFATQEQVGAVVNDIMIVCYQPGALCLIHCTLGCDRTGLVAGLLDLLHGVPVGEVMSRMIINCFHPYPALWRVLLRYAGVL